MLSKSSFVTFSLMLPLLGQAEWRDPTRPGNLSPSDIQVKTSQAPLKLSATWISQTNKRATINGKTVQQGQKLDHNITVLKIAPHYVLINDAGITKKLLLVPTSYKIR